METNKAFFWTCKIIKVFTLLSWQSLFFRQISTFNHMKEGSAEYDNTPCVKTEDCVSTLWMYGGRQASAMSSETCREPVKSPFPLLRGRAQPVTVITHLLSITADVSVRNRRLTGDFLTVRSSFWCRLALRRSLMGRATVLTGAAVCWLWSASAVRGWRRRTASLYKTYLWFITRVFHRHPCSVSVDRGRLWEYSCGGVWTRYAEGNGLEEKWRHRTNLQTVRN